MYRSIRAKLNKKNGIRLPMTQDDMINVYNSSRPPMRDFDYSRVSPKALDDHVPSREQSRSASQVSFFSDTTLDDSEPLGLALLHPTAKHIESELPIASSRIDDFDIIAIHGLGGHMYDSWTHENKTLWLRDLLPDAFPRARVFSYGYSSNRFFEEQKSGIQACADELLEALEWIWSNDVEISRPIIFICHGLGGILCKQFLLTMNLKDENHAIIAATHAVIFLDTPHRDFSCEKIADTFADLHPSHYISEANCMPGDRHMKLLDALTAKSRIIRQINSSFRRSAINIEIFSLYRTTSPPRVSDMSSAIVGVKNEEYLPLSIGHLEMGRYFGATDFNYKMIIHILWKIVTRMSIEIKLIDPAVLCHSDLVSSMGLEIYDTGPVFEDGRNESIISEQAESRRRRFATKVLVASGHGYKELPRLSIPHLPFPRTTIDFHRPRINIYKPSLKLTKIKLHKPKLRIRRPSLMPFRHASSWDPDDRVARTYLKHHGLRRTHGHDATAPKTPAEKSENGTKTNLKIPSRESVSDLE